METLLFILGGVALILYGVRGLRRGLDRLFGSRIGPWLQGLANRPVRAFLGGLGISLITPSSTSLSALAVQAVQSYSISPRQMLVLLLGADIGMTLTVQLLSLHIEHYAPLLILLGVVLYQYTTDIKSRGTGQVILSFGFLFLGIGIIQQSASTFDPQGDLVQLLQLAEKHPLGMAALAAMLTFVLQSTTATMGVILALAGSSTFRFTTSTTVAAIVGANVGVTITTLTMGWSQTNSRRMAVGNLLAKVAVGALVLGALPLAARLLERSSTSLVRQVANAHTGFNVLKAVLMLPLVGVLSKLAQVLVPKPSPDQAQVFGPRYLSNAPIDGTSLALGQSMRETLRVADIIHGMLEDLCRGLKARDEKLIRDVGARDDQVDLLENHIQSFLGRVGAENLDTDQSAEQMRQLRFLSELETISDIIDKNLCEAATTKIHLGSDFPNEAGAALETLFRMVLENMMIAATAFNTRDVLLAQKLLRHKEAMNRCADELRDQHFGRLNRGLAESHEVSAIYLDLVENLRRINSHVCHVAYGILQAQAPSRPPMEGLPTA